MAGDDIRNRQMILAAASKGIENEFDGTAFYPLAKSSIVKNLSRAGLWIGPRHHLEMDFGFRQLIPYVLLRMGGRFVRYTRSPAGGEGRLHGRMSIGLGGHIDLSDVVCQGNDIDLETTLAKAAQREVIEELGHVQSISREWIGILLDHESDVGRVHVGVVSIWSLHSPPHSSADDAVDDVTLCTIDELIGCRDELENWSRLMLDHLGQANSSP